MSQIDIEVVKKYLGKGLKSVGNLALNIYGETINEAGNRAFEDAINVGIQNTIAALYDANVEDSVIISLLNKHWGIPMDDATDLLVFEKTEAPMRELKQYLKMQGLTSKDILDFMTYNGVRHQLINNPNLRELRREPAKLMKTLKEHQ